VSYEFVVKIETQKNHQYNRKTIHEMTSDRNPRKVNKYYIRNANHRASPMGSVSRERNGQLPGHEMELVWVRVVGMTYFITKRRRI